MTNYTDYTAYFKQIAVDLFNHSDQEKHFFSKGLEEFLNGLQGNVNYPALLLEKYDYKYNDNGADNVMKPRTIGFIVCDNNPDMEDYQRNDQIMDTCEELVDKIYNRIRKAISPPGNEFLQYAKLNNVQVSPVDNYADGNSGYFVTMEIESFHNTSLI